MLSFVALAAIAGGFTYALIMGDEARDEAPDLRNEIERAVDAAVRAGDLSTDPLVAGVAQLSEDGSVLMHLPRVEGARLRSHALDWSDDVFEFSYEGTSRAPGYCFPGSVGSDRRVRVEFTRC